MPISKASSAACAGVKYAPRSSEKSSEVTSDERRLSEKSTPLRDVRVNCGLVIVQPLKDKPR